MKELIAILVITAAIIGAYVYIDLSQRESAERYEEMYGK